MKPFSLKSNRILAIITFVILLGAPTIAEESTMIEKLFSLTNKFESGPQFEVGLGGASGYQEWSGLSFSMGLNYKLSRRHTVGVDHISEGPDMLQEPGVSTKFQITYRYDWLHTNFFTQGAGIAVGVEEINSRADDRFRPGKSPVITFENKMGLVLWYTGLHITPSLSFSAQGAVGRVHIGYTLGIQ